MNLWTYADFSNGFCDAGDVGSKKPENAENSGELIPQPVDPNLPLTDTLEADIRATYFELGGRDYLRRNPALLNKMLLRQAPAAAERRTLTVEERHYMEIQFQQAKREMPWVSPKRLAYQEGVRLAEDIEGVRSDDGGAFFRRPDWEEVHGAYLAGSEAEPEPAAEPSPGPAAPSAADSAPTPLAERIAPPQRSAEKPEDSRQHWGPRGNAKHR